MKATIVSTDRIVPIDDGQGGSAVARVWEGVTDKGVPFIAYIARVQVRRTADNSEFERDLQEHTPPSAETLRAIDLRFIL